MTRRFASGPPSPEEFQKQMADFMRQHLPNLSFFRPQTGSGTSSETPTDNQRSAGSFSFDKKPRDVKAYLDRFVIKQEEAKKVLAIAVCDHYNHAADFHPVVR